MIQGALMFVLVTLTSQAGYLVLISVFLCFYYISLFIANTDEIFIVIVRSLCYFSGLISTG